MNELIESFKRELQIASDNSEKLATFHYLILANAEALRDVSVIEFCDALAVSKGYVSEMRQMLGLHKMLVQRRAFIAHR